MPPSIDLALVVPLGRAQGISGFAYIIGDSHHICFADLDVTWLAMLLEHRTKRQQFVEIVPDHRHMDHTLRYLPYALLLSLTFALGPFPGHQVTFAAEPARLSSRIVAITSRTEVPSAGPFGVPRSPMPLVSPS